MVELLYLGYWFSVTQTLTRNYVCRSVTYISWSSDFALYQDFLAILNYLLISAYSGLLKFEMKMFVNIARLDIGQLFTQRVRRGHLCTLDTFLVAIRVYPALAAPCSVKQKRPFHFVILDIIKSCFVL